MAKAIFWFIAGALIFVVYIFFNNYVDRDVVEKARAETLKKAADTVIPEIKRGWKYDKSIDEMDGNISYFAGVISEDAVKFAYSYNGDSYFQLSIRNRNKKNEVILRMSNELAGQFMPSIISPPKTCRVKFDDNTPINYGYSSAASDGSSSVIFFFNSNKFISNLKNSQKLMVECEFFQEGRKLIKFDVKGLEWDK
jgi:hypothetical protein